MVKTDGSVHGPRRRRRYKPRNWMTPPTVIEEEPRSDRRAQARGPARTGSRSASPRCSRTSTTTWATRPRSRRTASRPTSRRRWPTRPHCCGEGFRLVRREWPTDIGPVDLMCRDADDGWIAVEIKRVGTIDAVEQLTRYLERIRLDPGSARFGRSRRRPEIAEALGIADGTVETHLGHLFQKTGAKHQADLVKLVAGFSESPDRLNRNILSRRRPSPRSGDAGPSITR